MQHMPLKIRTSTLLTLIFITFGVIGCSSAPKDRFIPPVYPLPPDEPRFIYERTILGSANVEELSTAEKFRMMATGTSQSGVSMAKPFGIAAHKGKIYVSDTVHRAILLFDIQGKKFKKFGTEGAGQLAKPIGIDVDLNGNVYVADNTAKRVVMFDGDGNFIKALGGRDYLTRPSGVCVDTASKRAFIVDTGGVSNNDHRIQIFDIETGELIKTLGTRGREDGQFNLPLLCASDEKGSIYVVDAGNFRVQEFDTDGNHLLSHGKVGKNFGDFARPKGIGVDPEGNHYVVDTSFSNIQLFNSDGELLMFMGDPGPNIPGKYQLLSDVAIDEDGRIYLVDQFFRKIDVFRPYALTREEGYTAPDVNED